MGYGGFWSRPIPILLLVSLIRPTPTPSIRLLLLLHRQTPRIHPKNITQPEEYPPHPYFYIACKYDIQGALVGRTLGGKYIRVSIVIFLPGRNLALLNHIFFFIYFKTNSQYVPWKKLCNEIKNISVYTSELSVIRLLSFFNTTVHFQTEYII